LQINQTRVGPAGWRDSVPYISTDANSRVYLNRRYYTNCNCDCACGNI
jgi:hypothetical protein